MMEQMSNDRAWDLFIEMPSISDEDVIEAMEHYRELYETMQAVWDARCKVRARHKRFQALWRAMENDANDCDAGPSLGSKARLVWDYGRTHTIIDPEEAANTIGLTKKNVQQLLASRRDLFDNTDDGWKVKTEEVEQLAISSFSSSETITIAERLTKRKQIEQIDGMREKIHDYLSENGPTKPALIAIALGVSDDVVTTLTQHKWFKKMGDGIAVA